MNVAILGLGLIGGSIGLAIGGREGSARIVGFDADPEAVSRALATGAIDEGATDLAAAVARADVVFAAAPIGALPQMVREALRAAPADCVVTDVGSTKRALLCELREEPGIERFVGGHPLAGSEQGGIERARGDLFEGSAWCLTPAPSPSAAQSAAHERLAGLVEGLGAHVVEIDAETHDALMARISHLPHVLANVLVTGTACFGERELALATAGPSFRDATRVAGASTAVWRDIYLSNADLVIDAIDATIAQLQQVRDLLRDGDGEALSRWNEQARARKRALAPPCP